MAARHHKHKGSTRNLPLVRSSPASATTSARRRGNRTSSRLASFFVCLALIALTWLVFGQTLWHNFVNLDDHVYVYDNPLITRGLTVDGVINAFAHTHARNWHPLTTLSHMLDCQLFGLKAGGHHFTNVLFHTVSVAAALSFAKTNDWRILAKRFCGGLVRRSSRCMSNQWHGYRNAKMCSAASFSCSLSGPIRGTCRREAWGAI